jgi:tRNA(fMet)-specific endonuclease VapC
VFYYGRLAELFAFYAGWTILPFDAAAAERFERLVNQRIRIKTMDLKIAAITLLHGGTLLSADHHFRQVPGLHVGDWLHA